MKSARYGPARAILAGVGYLRPGVPPIDERAAWATEMRSAPEKQMSAPQGAHLRDSNLFPLPRRLSEGTRREVCTQRGAEARADVEALDS